ncbi:aspartic peptidase domain-containing protein [Lineolata rhizophorae]|uniref:Aspartic peptidase domain-containing protein n=1 Tax=Lineolata rhizophorae TaxID=578093 RepID=A0A6A6PD70_9PEZI|nr:aspartic peptidase domain-containing protein [Lineolata rhizophorae]
MPSVHSLATFLALAGATFAAPTNTHVFSKRSFSINQVARGQRLKSAPLEMRRTYRKYGKPVPTQVDRAAAAVSTGSAPANPAQYDQYYLTPVEVGGQDLELDIDTGSGDLWVFSTMMNSTTTSGRTLYDPARSNSSDLLEDETWRIQYGDGSGAAGVVYADKVVVGGVTATSQAVEAATSVSRSFAEDADMDGLMGLSFGSINTVEPTRQQTFFESVVGSLDEPVFAVTLKSGEPGSYDFGFVDPAKYDGELTYVDVDSSDGFWQFAVDGYGVGGSGPANSSSSFTCIADTGSSLMYVPSGPLNEYYGAVEGATFDRFQGAWTLPCDAELPDFSLVIGGASLVVPGRFVSYAPVDDTNETCYGGMQSSAGIGFCLLGDVFLKGLYVVHDVGTSPPRMGWAQQAGLDVGS